MLHFMESMIFITRVFVGVSFVAGAFTTDGGRQQLNMLFSLVFGSKFLGGIFLVHDCIGLVAK